MHLQNIACAVFAIKGMEKRVAVVLVGVCSPIDIKQSSDMEMEGKGRMAAHYSFVWI